MKDYKEFKQAHPETVGEKDHAFDMSNYIDWTDGEYLKAKVKNVGDIGDVMYSACDEYRDGINMHCAECGESKHLHRRILYGSWRY